MDTPQDLISEIFFQSPITTFLVLCKTQNFSKAAKILDISQSGVSRQISQLEKQLGISLIQREARPVRPTPQGQFLLKLLLQEKEVLSRDLEELLNNNLRKLPLRFGCINSIAWSLGPYLSVSLLKHYSPVEITAGISIDLLEQLLDDKLDAIVISEPYFEVGGLKRQFLFSEPAIVALPKKLILPNSMTWSHLQLCGLPKIEYEQKSGASHFEVNYFNQMGEAAKFVHRLRVNANALFLPCIAKGLGWGITFPTTLAQFPQFAKSVQIRPSPKPVAKREIYFITKKDFKDSFIKMVCEKCIECFTKEIVPLMTESLPEIDKNIEIFDSNDLTLRKKLA